MAGYEFDEATALTRSGTGWTADVDPGWFVRTANGGYVASLLLAAMTEAMGEPDRPARSLSVHYPRPVGAGLAALTAAVSKRGKSLHFLTATLHQAGDLAAQGLAAFGHGRETPEFQDLSVDGVPPPDALPGLTLPGGVAVPIAQRFDYRPVDSVTLFSGERSAYRSWIRVRDGRPVDALLLATVVDALVPAMFLRTTTPMIAPTIDLTVHFRQVPPAYDGWLLADIRTRAALDGFVEEDVDLYDESGGLVAQSRQLAILVPFG